MNLRRLKKQLNQQHHQARKNKPRRRNWLLLIFLLIALAIALVPVYQRHELTMPQRLFSQAAEQESLGKIAAAQQLYQKLYQNYPRSDLAAQALLENAKIWQFDRLQDQQALLCYLQLEHDYPDHPLVLAAQEAAAHITKYSLRDYSQAISYYQRLLERAAGTPDRYLYELADCYFRLDNYTQARIELETLLEQYPQSSLLADVLYRKGALLLLENRLNEARQDWQRLVNEYPDSSYSIQARFNLAKLLEEEDRLQEALELYLQLRDYPRPNLVEEKIEHLKQRIAVKKKAI